MEKVSKSVLKAKMLEYFRKVEESGEELIVTDNRRPVLKIVPIRTRVPAAEAFHDVRGKLVYRADLLEPESDEWPET
ncbi:MAG: prevent-host-death protein [Myxococcota bacterium]